MYDDGFNPTALKACACTGVLFTLMWLGGAGPATGFIYLPPPSAADLAVKTVADYTHNIMRMRIGCLLMITASALYISWGMTVTLLTRKIEKDYPIFFFIQVISLAACAVVVLLIGYFWGAAAFRAGETGPDVTQALNDVGWLGVLFTGAPFAAYQIALAGSILMDKSAQPVYPRWSAYWNLFVSVFMIEAGLMLLFKTGPFSQSGLFTFYIPMIVFFAWILMFSYLPIKAINAEVAARSTARGRVTAPSSRSAVRPAGATSMNRNRSGA